jgi:hypothetical protein
MPKGLLLSERAKNIKTARKLLKNSNLAMHVGSVAVGLESLETLLVEKGILKDDELLERVRKLTAQKAEQWESSAESSNQSQT